MSANGQPLNPAKIVTYSLLGALALNVVLFSVNLLKGVWSIRSVSDEEELREAMEPLLRGLLTEVGASATTVVAVLFVALLGVAGGGLALLLIDWLRA